MYHSQLASDLRSRTRLWEVVEIMQEQLNMESYYGAMPDCKTLEQKKKASGQRKRDERLTCSSSSNQSNLFSHITVILDKKKITMKI